MDAPSSATTVPPLSPAQRRLTLAAVIACISVFGTVLGLTLPLLSLILERQGIDAGLIGLSAATPALAILLASFLIPALVSRFGQRPVLIVAMLTIAVALLLLRTFPDVWIWFPIRFAMGFGMAGLFIVSESWINQIAEPEKRGQTIAIYTTTLAVAFVAGPLILIVIGTHGWLPFLLAAAVSLLGIVPLALPGLYLPPDGGHTARRPVLSFLWLAPVLMLATFTSAFADGAAMGLFPVYAVRTGLGEAVAPVLIAAAVAGGVCLQYPVGWAADRFGVRPVMLLCGLAGVVGSTLLPVLVGGFLLWPTIFLWGGAIIALYSLALTALGQRFTGGDLVAGNAAFAVMWGAGNLAGPALGGFAIDLWNPHGLAVALVASCLVFVAVALASRRPS